MTPLEFLFLALGLFLFGLVLASVSAWMHVRLRRSLLKDWAVAITYVPGNMLALAGIWIAWLLALESGLLQLGVEVRGFLAVAALAASGVLAVVVYRPIQALFRKWIRRQAPGEELSWGRDFLASLIDSTRKL